MAPRKVAREEDKLVTVILIDIKLFETDLGKAIAAKLKEAYSESGQAKICPKVLTIPYSVQWIVPVRDLDGNKVGKNWKTVPHTMVFQNTTTFSEWMKKSKEPEEFVTLMFGENFQEIFKNQKIRLIIHNENDVRSKKPRNNMSVEERHLVNELKQMHGAKKL